MMLFLFGRQNLIFEIVNESALSQDVSCDFILRIVDNKFSEVYPLIADGSYEANGVISAVGVLRR